MHNYNNRNKVSCKICQLKINPGGNFYWIKCELIYAKAKYGFEMSEKRGDQFIQKENYIS